MTSRTRRGAIGLLLVAGLTGGTLAGCGTAAGTSSPPGPSSTSAAGGATSTPVAAAAAAPAARPAFAALAAPAAAPGLLRPGSSGPEVLALQQRLASLGYWLGTADGHYGDLTVQAVTALQKVAGLDRDGVVGPRTRAALDAGTRPSARSTSGHVIEVDLRRQVVLVVDGGRVGLVLNTSTGSGAWYTAPNGRTGHAVTPPGRFTTLRGVDGWDTSPLGHLYRPRYFNGGIAVHGYTSVPPQPASHGCVRVSLPAMDLIWGRGLMPVGGTVRVY